MDRLPVVTTALAALLACTSCEERSAPPAERVNAVKAAKPKGPSLGAFCDSTPKTPTRFAYPKLAGMSPTHPPGAWRWINVWATWCKPCVEEMPRLQKWQADLSRDGRKVKLLFLSIDENEQDVAAFRAKHPDLAEGPRVADPKELAEWYRSVGLDEGAPVPIHIWVDPEGLVRCVRAGGVRDKDYASVEQVIASAQP
ncbi:MAG: TlpA family protein disulfide reductase [Deltaproteobacteria bacterium]|nr:TlpA family protein disulfide reductase [Deltaproteobacteria bacterium]